MPLGNEIDVTVAHCCKSLVSRTIAGTYSIARANFILGNHSNF